MFNLDHQMRATETPEEVYSFFIQTTDKCKKYGLFNVDGGIKRVCTNTAKYKTLIEEEIHDFIGVYDKSSVSDYKEGNLALSREEFIEELYFALGKKIPA